jgi:hypothetical protein
MRSILSALVMISPRMTAASFSGGATAMAARLGRINHQPILSCRLYLAVSQTSIFTPATRLSCGPAREQISLDTCFTGSAGAFRERWCQARRDRRRRCLANRNHRAHAEAY